MDDVKENQGANSTEFFGEHAARWLRLYEAKPAFQDRLELFTESVQTALPGGSGPVLVRIAERS